MKRFLPFLMPSLGSLVFLLVFFGALSVGPKMMNMDGDLGRHLTIGQYILDSGRIPLQDLFSHTLPGAELTPHEWLSQVIFALSYRGLGLNGPVWVTAAVIAAAITLSFQQAFKRSNSLLLSLFLVILAIAASSLHWLTRPHIFTFLFVSIWMAGLERLREGKLKGWFALPILMLAWANLHGAFIAGFMLWGLYGVGYLWERWVEDSPHGGFAPGFGRPFLLVGGLSAVATLFNPVGPRLWATSIGYLGSGYLVGHTAEYLSPDFHSPTFWPFLLLILLGLAVFGLSATRRRAADVIVLAAWAAMGLYSARNIPLFALVALPILAEGGSQILKDLAGRHRLFDQFNRFDERMTIMENSFRGWVWPAAGLILALLAFSAGIRLDAGQKGNRFDPAVFPAGAVAWLEENPQQGQMFNYFPWGGYLLFKDWPRWQVFIDGQTDFYGEALTRSYEQALTAGEGWQAVLEKYGVEWVLLPPQEELVRKLEQMPGWAEVYRDNTAVVIVKK